MATKGRDTKRQSNGKSAHQRGRPGSDPAGRQNPKPPTNPARAPDDELEPADETQGIRRELEEMDNDRNI